MDKYKQDMPPPGGYAPIAYKYVPLKGGLSLPLKAAITLGMTGFGLYAVILTKRQHNIERIEMSCAKVALSPMLLAEVDRMYLKQIRRNREEEERIMKNVEGWEVGKYKGQPVYLSLRPDEFYPATSSEFYAHADDALKYYSYNIAKF